jgi:glyoxylase-like metal-dependent hydrolase (beta-lactamase superfamily II)
LAAFALAALVTPAAAQPAGPMVLAGTARQVSEHVHVIPDGSRGLVPNVGIVVGNDAALVVDTGMGEANGRVVLAEARRLAPGRALYLVTTHFHPEHDLGAGAFPPETRMIRSADQEKDIAEFGLQLAEVFAGRSPVNAELLKGATFRKADITFDQARDFDLGGVRVRLMAMGPNHTRGDTAVLVEGDQVLFAGDVVMQGQPAFASPYSSLAHWLESLDRLEALKPRVIVPSHGPTGDAAMIGAYRTYLTTIRDRTAALKRQGRSADEAVQAVTAELQPRYRDAGRLGGAIRAAYAEAR